jgi:hypothetical protein
MPCEVPTRTRWLVLIKPFQPAYALDPEDPPA